MIGMLVLFMTINWSCQNTPKAKNEPPVDYLKESKVDFDQRMKWWREARFGMFIHWGVYAVPAGIHNGFKTKGVGEWIQLLLKFQSQNTKGTPKSSIPQNTMLRNGQSS